MYKYINNSSTLTSNLKSFLHAVLASFCTTDTERVLDIIRKSNRQDKIELFQFILAFICSKPQNAKYRKKVLAVKSIVLNLTWISFSRFCTFLMFFCLNMMIDITNSAVLDRKLDITGNA